VGLNIERNRSSIEVFGERIGDDEVTYGGPVLIVSEVGLSAFKHGLPERDGETDEVD